MFGLTPPNSGSTISRPFTKLTNHEGTETGFIISFKKFPEIEEEFYKNLKTTLTKMSSSKKTKALHSIIESKVLFLGYGMAYTISSTQPIYGINYNDSNTLKGIVADVSKVIEPTYQQDFISNLNVISSQVETIKQQESMLTTTGTEIINMAKESIISKYKDLLANIDWFQLLDIYYFQYLKFLARRTILQNKGKVFVHLNNILHTTIKDIVLNYSSGKNLEKSDAKIVQILIDYLVITQYSNNPKQETLNSIFKNLIQNTKDYEDALKETEEIIKRIKDLKATRYDKLEDITYALAEMKIINITPNAFIKLVGDKFGQKFFDFNHTIDGVLSYLCSLLHTSELFMVRTIPEKKEIEDIEELILNAKGSTLIKPF